MRSVRLDTAAAAQVVAGHPIVPRDRLSGREAHQGRPGEQVALVDGRGQFLAGAVAEGDERIAYRIFSRQPEARLDEELLSGLFCRALALRRNLALDSDAWRLFHGDGEGLSGLAVDTYGDFLSVQCYSSGLTPYLPAAYAVLSSLVKPAGICLTDRTRGPQASRTDEGKGRRVSGESPPAGFTVREGAAGFGIDLGGGYNSGLFLDNRENRLALRHHVRGRRVLNLFSYTASISVHAAMAGAATVVSVDTSDRMQKWAARNFELNGLSTAEHPLVKADALEYLAKGAHRGILHDLIVLDPPSFSTSKKGVFTTAKDYPRLVSMALEVLAPGGILALCSNHHKTTPDRFLTEAAEMARRQKRPLKLIDFRGAGPDFPIDLAYPEAAYLKFAILAS